MRTGTGQRIILKTNVNLRAVIRKTIDRIELFFFGFFRIGVTMRVTKTTWVMMRMSRWH